MHNEEIKSYFILDDVNNCLLWKNTCGTRAIKNTQAGSISKEGYIKIKLKGKSYLAHRLIWLMFYGEWPKNEIDHIDGNRLNNSISNLRDVTRSINQKNAHARKDNVSGVRGVHYIKHKGEYWVARWSEFNKPTCAKWFSIAKHGYDKAKQKAILHRKQMLENIGGYTERHGL